MDADAMGAQVAIVPLDAQARSELGAPGRARDASRRSRRGSRLLLRACQRLGPRQRREMRTLRYAPPNFSSSPDNRRMSGETAGTSCMRATMTARNFEHDSHLVTHF
jgi:hypothetical protein